MTTWNFARMVKDASLHPCFLASRPDSLFYHRYRAVGGRVAGNGDLAQQGWGQREHDYSAGARYHATYPCQSKRPHQLEAPSRSGTSRLASLHEGITPSHLVERLEEGTEVTVAGFVAVRQAPETAKGFVFHTLEDRYGLVNVITAPNLVRRYKELIAEAGALVVTDTSSARSGRSTSSRSTWSGWCWTADACRVSERTALGSGCSFGYLTHTISSSLGPSGQVPRYLRQQCRSHNTVGAVSTVSPS